LGGRGHEAPTKPKKMLGAAHPPSIFVSLDTFIRMKKLQELNIILSFSTLQITRKIEQTQKAFSQKIHT